MAKILSLTVIRQPYLLSYIFAVQHYKYKFPTIVLLLLIVII